MSRLDIRCKVDLPVHIIANNNGGKGVTETQAKFTSLSLSGGFIDYAAPYDENKILGLRYDLPKHGEFEILGEVTRSENDGFAARFYNINRDTKLKLWDYIKENIAEDLSCPYCGKEHTQKLR